MINVVLPFDTLNFFNFYSDLCVDGVRAVSFRYVKMLSVRLFRGAVMSGPVSAKAILALQAVTSVN